MKWIDTLDIAIELAESHPDVDPRTINFVDLHRLVCELDGFDDDPRRSGEKSSKPFSKPGSKSCSRNRLPPQKARNSRVFRYKILTKARTICCFVRPAGQRAARQ